MELKLLNGKDQVAGKVEAPDTIFGREYTHHPNLTPDKA